MVTIPPNFPSNLPDSTTLHHQFARYHAPSISKLKNCSNLREFQQIHAQIVKIPSDQTYVSLAKLIESLVDLNHIDYARNVFDEMPEWSTFIFNNLIRGYGEAGIPHEGIYLYNRMRKCSISPDKYTYPFLLKACGSLLQGKAVHSCMFKSAEFQLDVYSQTSLVTFYSNHGDLQSARKVFDKMPERNIVSWTAIIAGYLQNKRYSSSLALFHEMHVYDVEPNEITLVNVITACANLRAYEMGKWAHRLIERKGIFVNSTLGTALVNMYMKCGHVNESWKIFKNLPEKSVFTWNALIGGLAMNELGKKALTRFEEMLVSGTKPNEITLIAVLSACAHAGLVEKGRDYFNSMESKFGIQPNIKHYGCLVDILGRAGLLCEAHEIVSTMPFEPNTVIWGTLLYSCSKHGNVELAELVMEKLVELEPFNEGKFLLMLKIYESKGQWKDVAKVRKFMKDRDILSSMQVDNMMPIGMYTMLSEVAEKLKAKSYI